MYIHIYVCMYVCMYVCVYIYICTCICEIWRYRKIRINRYADVVTDSYIYIYIHIYTYIYTYVHTCTGIGLVYISTALGAHVDAIYISRYVKYVDADRIAAISHRLCTGVGIGAGVGTSKGTGRGRGRDKG